MYTSSIKRIDGVYNLGSTNYCFKQTCFKIKTILRLHCVLVFVYIYIYTHLYSKWTSQYNASEVFTLYSETSNMSYTFIYKYNNCVDVRLRARLSNTHTQNSRAERKLLLCRLHKVVHIIHACGHECCEIIRYFILLNQCFVFAHTPASLSFCQLDLLRASQ